MFYCLVPLVVLFCGLNTLLTCLWVCGLIVGFAILCVAWAYGWRLSWLRVVGCCDDCLLEYAWYCWLRLLVYVLVNCCFSCWCLIPMFMLD